MTLSSPATTVTQNEHGGTTVFPTAFIFWKNTDIRVIHRYAPGVEVVWSEGAQNTLTGGGGVTGMLTVKTTPTEVSWSGQDNLSDRFSNTCSFSGISQAPRGVPAACRIFTMSK